MSTSIYSGMGHSDLATLKERSYDRTPRERSVAIGLGVVTLVCAVLGVAYNAFSLAHVLSGDAFDQMQGFTHVRAAFYLMSSACLACYGGLILGACRLLSGRTTPTILLVSIWILEILYFLTVGFAWLLPEVGLSSAAATGGGEFGHSLGNG